MKQEIEKLKEQLIKLPSDISLEEKKLFIATEHLKVIAIEKSKMEITLSKEIREETINLIDKNKPKYSNEVARENELRERCWRNIGYQELTEKQNKFSETIQRTKSDLDEYKREFKSIAYLIDLLKLERGVL